MASKKETSGIKADIPSAAVEEALRSVEKHTAEAEKAPVESGAQDDREASAEVESLRAQVELSQQKGRETLERLKEEHERFLRAAADLENYRKRAHREREEVQRYGIEKLLKDLIPVLDNLERAFKAAAADDPLAGGVKLVLRSFEETLGRYGVKAFSALGQPFDPQLHEALLEVKSAESPGTVILEQGRGYLLNERLVRPAMVGIAVAGSDPATSTESVPAESAVRAGKAGEDQGGETGSSQG